MIGKPLEGRRAVVTGGTRGIGRAIAFRLRDDGAQVLATGTRPDGAAPEGCDYGAVDFADRAATEAFAAKLAALAPHILVNNAGVTKPQAFAEIGTEEFARVHQVNLVAPMILCRAALPGMRAAGWGRIVNISSIWGTVSKTGRATYGASKAGLNGLTAGLAAEVAADGILANCVSPGFIDTEMTRGTLTDAQVAALERIVPIGRLAQPNEIAAFVAWMVGPENTYISGQAIPIDGGFTMV
jgi:NAD(P)-dependent dehydrogenase (short-subunit alcohol dehydrogenase family)